MASCRRSPSLSSALLKSTAAEARATVQSPLPISASSWLSGQAAKPWKKATSSMAATSPRAAARCSSSSDPPAWRPGSTSLDPLLEMRESSVQWLPLAPPERMELFRKAG
eukprot:6185203-Pleurochrysis_carterae.AAC.1